jgi:hypothetical protein
MGMSQRDNHLESAGLMFGVEGKLALAEYYTSLADPGLFTWGAAVEHIAYRLQLPDSGFSHLAVAVASELLRRHHMTASSNGTRRPAI